MVAIYQLLLDNIQRDVEGVGLKRTKRNLVNMILVITS